MKRAWCYVCSSYGWVLEYDPYNHFEDGQKMKNHSSYCIKCMNEMQKTRLKFKEKKEEIIRRRLLESKGVEEYGTVATGSKED